VGDPIGSYVRGVLNTRAVRYRVVSREIERDTAEGWIENPAYVNRATVVSWLRQHNASVDEFEEDNGTADEYRSDKVFEWLGY
jgi:hypothetical protein